MAYYGGGYPMGQQSFQQQQPPYGGGYQQQPPQFQQQPPQMGYNYSQQHMQRYQNWGQPSQHYGQYGNYYKDNVFSVQAWQAFQFNSVSDLQIVFNQEMQKNPENAARNAIQSEDLVNILNNTPSIRNYFGINWSREMCSIMIAMLDRSKDGFMQWEEFMELQQCLVAWYKVFCQHDSDRSGFIDAGELIRVIRQLFRYNISKECLETLLKRYSRVVPGRGCIIAFDDFVAVAVRLRAYTDAFRRRDAMLNGGETGNCMFGYDDFLRCVMCL